MLNHPDAGVLSALGIGLGGAAISAATSLGWSLPGGVATAFALAIAAGTMALAISRQLPDGRTTSDPSAQPGPGQPEPAAAQEGSQASGRPIGAIVASVARTRSAGASSTSRPR